MTIEVWCEDTDRDGVPDIRDIDDDNDGLIDVRECSDATTSQPVAVINGGFEIPAIAPGAIDPTDASQVHGWSTTAPDNLIEFWPSGLMPPELEIPIVSYERSQHVEVNSTQVAELFHDVVTAPGATMAWQFAHRGRSSTVTPDRVELLIGPPGAEVSQGIFNSTSQQWQRFSGTYVVPPAQIVTRMMFRAVSAADGDLSQGNFLDAVSFSLLACDVDTDQDTVSDRIDLDSDNDGIPDAIEAGGVDGDGDGALDDFVDLDLDGLHDLVDPINSGRGAGEVTSGTALPTPNTDGVGSADFRDLDADDDGIPDNVEAQSTTGYRPPSERDDDGDGLDNTYDPDSGLALLPLINSDLDDTPDYRDSDADNDGIRDVAENGSANAPDGSDSDGDGLDDAFEGDDILDGFDVNDELETPAHDLPDDDGDALSGGDVDYREAFVSSAFTCDGTWFVSTSSDGVTQLNTVDVSVNPFGLSPLGDTSHGTTYNALAYHPQDHALYAIMDSTNEVVRIGADGLPINLGPATGLPIPASRYDAGAITASGTMMVLEADTTILYEIDLASLTLDTTAIPLVDPLGGLRVSDVAINPVDGLLYGINTRPASESGQVTQIDPVTGVVTRFGPNHDLFIDANFFDNNGNLYGVGRDGRLLRFDLGSGDATELSNGQNWVDPGAELDGAACPAGIGTSGLPGVALAMSVTGVSPWTVTLEYTLENFGSESVLALSLLGDLDTIFGTPGVDWSLSSIRKLSGPDSLSENVGFDGIAASQPEILSAGSRLGAAGSGQEAAQIQVVLSVNTPGLFTNQATVRGETLNGTPRSDLSDAGTDPDENGNGDPADDQDPSQIRLNAPPVATSDQALTQINTPITVPDVTANDTDRDGMVDASTVDLNPGTPGQQLTFTVGTQGVFTADHNGNMTFVPEPGYAGTLSITYTVSDDGGVVSNAVALHDSSQCAADCRGRWHHYRCRCSR